MADDLARDARVRQLAATDVRQLRKRLADLETARPGNVALVWRACPINRLTRDELISQILEAEGL